MTKELTDKQKIALSRLKKETKFSDIWLQYWSSTNLVHNNYCDFYHDKSAHFDKLINQLDDVIRNAKVLQSKFILKQGEIQNGKV